MFISVSIRCISTNGSHFPGDALVNGEADALGEATVAGVLEGVGVGVSARVRVMVAAIATTHAKEVR